MARYSFIVPESNEYRLDKFLVLKLGEYSRAYLQKLIRDGCILVNDLPVKQQKKLKAQDLISVKIPEPVSLEILPEDIPLDIIYEDSDLVVLSKAPGMVVHPSGQMVSGTLVNALLYRMEGLSKIGGVLRPGIVHRLDKNTSGLMMVAKNDKAHHSLTTQLKERTVIKKYTALLKGVLKKNSGKVELPIGRHPVDRKRMYAFPDKAGHAKHALTSYNVIERFPYLTLVNAAIHTGRTHQIRVHFASMGHSVFGDDVYGTLGKMRLKDGSFLIASRQCLHSSYLEFTHPTTMERLNFTAKIYSDFAEILEVLYRLRL